MNKKLIFILYILVSLVVFNMGNIILVQSGEEDKSTYEQIVEEHSFEKMST